MPNEYTQDLAVIAVIRYLVNQHAKTIHYDSLGAPLWPISVLESPNALWDTFLGYIRACRAGGSDFWVQESHSVFLYNNPAKDYSV